MNKIASKSILFILLILVLSGCWDENMLKDVRLFMSSSFDLTDEGKISIDVSSPVLSRNQQGAGSVRNYTLTTGIGNTPREARGDVDKKTSKTFDGSKLRVLIIGSELAKHDIYSVLDLFYRDPKSSLSAKLIVAEGKAKDLLRLSIEDEKIGEYLYDLLDSQEQVSLAPRENIQSICAEMFDPGEDFVLPYIKPKDEDVAMVEGIALFNGRHFTGHVLSDDEAVVFLLMDGNAGKTAKFTKKISEEEHPSPSQFVSFDVRSFSQRLEVKVEKGRPSAVINLKMKVVLTDYPRNQLNKKGEVEKLNKKLTELLTKDAEEAIRIIQEANSDSFGIGRRLIALHNDYWKKADWKKEYPKIQITPKVEVEIKGHGIIE